MRGSESRELYQSALYINRILWGIRVFEYPNGEIVIGLARSSRKTRSISFSIRELPQLIEALNRIKERFLHE